MPQDELRFPHELQRQDSDDDKWRQQGILRRKQRWVERPTGKPWPVPRSNRRQRKVVQLVTSESTTTRERVQSNPEQPGKHLTTKPRRHRSPPVRLPPHGSAAPSSGDKKRLLLLRFVRTCSRVVPLTVVVREIREKGLLGSMAESISRRRAEAEMQTRDAGLHPVACGHTTRAMKQSTNSISNLAALAAGVDVYQSKR